MDKKDALPGTHAGLTRRSWEHIREGLKRCAESSEDRHRCLEWCRKFPDHTGIWTEIIEGRHKDMTDAVLGTENFFDLPSDDMVLWENIIQNHPFSAIFAKERYEQLLKKRKCRSICS
jgi:hypothetical protein